MISTFDIDEERELRIRDLNDGGGDSASRFWSSAHQQFQNSDLAMLRDTAEFAEGLNYHHPGLSPQTYLAHPYRVARLSLMVLPEPNLEVCRLALVHNILEVASVEPDDLVARLGTEMTRAIEVLTVDRSRSDDTYFEHYFASIDQTGPVPRTVKILDKLDNMFVLCLNPDDAIRDKYLGDIERYLFPLISKQLPHLLGFFTELVADCRSTGHRPLSSWRVTDGVVQYVTAGK